MLRDWMLRTHPMGRLEQLLLRTTDICQMAQDLLELLLCMQYVNIARFTGCRTDFGGSWHAAIADAQLQSKHQCAVAAAASSYLWHPALAASPLAVHQFHPGWFLCTTCC
jgi:hypothetical protein